MQREKREAGPSNERVERVSGEKKKRQRTRATGRVCHQNIHDTDNDNENDSDKQSPTDREVFLTTHPP